VTLTSATLSIARDMESFKRKVGAEAEEACRVDSPFDYENNTRVYVVADMPIAAQDNPRSHVDTMIDYIEYCASRVKGGSLVLFTNYTDLKKAHDLLYPVFKEMGRELFAQGEGLSRSELAQQFRDAGNGVLFGTDSFWTGVDIPGAALSQVIITRLPFDVPTHPITEAKSEYIREQGGHPFSDMSLPDALVKFRQGVGRLIRKWDDKGIITLLDSRILSKSYGRQFLQSLPKTKFIRIRKEDRDQRFCDIDSSPPALQDRFYRD